MCSRIAPLTADLSVRFSDTNQLILYFKNISLLKHKNKKFLPKLYQTSISPLKVRTSIIVWPKKSSDSRVNFWRSLLFKSLSSSLKNTKDAFKNTLLFRIFLPYQTRTLILSVELWHSKRNFSFQTGFNSWWIVPVFFFTLPICTVTYGSLLPVLSFAINPWAHITARKKNKTLITFQPKSIFSDKKCFS